MQERFAVQHFIDALNDKEDRLYLRREKTETLNQALSAARELESLRLLDNNNLFRLAVKSEIWRRSKRNYKCTLTSLNTRQILSTTTIAGPKTFHSFAALIRETF